MKNIILIILIICSITVSAKPAMKYNSRYKAYIPKKKFWIRPARKIVKIDKEITMVLFAARFAQGSPVYVEIRKSWQFRKQQIANVKFYFNKKYYPLNSYKDGVYGLFAIHPFSKLGYRRITIKCEIDSRKITRYFWIKVRKTWFKKYTGFLNVGKFSDANYYKKHRAFIKRSYRKKMAAFRTFSGNYLKKSRSHPRDVHLITSPFWTLRRYYSYKWRKGKKIRVRSNYSPHRGLDMYGRTGDPVYAMADGRIVLADKLFYEGNIVIIDHGNKIFSYYMHLSKLHVKKGQLVRANQVVARAGSTGISTAAHLHVSLMISGVQVNPLYFLSLPMRKYKP